MTRNPRTRWVSQWDSLGVPLNYMAIRGDHHLLKFMPWRWRHSWSRDGRLFPGSSLPRILCACYSIMRGRCPWRQTPVDCWGRCLPPWTLCRHGTPPCTILGLSITSRAASILRRLPFFPCWAGGQRGFLWGRNIAWAEGRVQGIRSGNCQGRSCLTPLSTSVGVVPPLSRRSMDFSGAWGERGLVTPWRWCWLMWHSK